MVWVSGPVPKACSTRETEKSAALHARRTCEILAAVEFEPANQQVAFHMVAQVRQDAVDRGLPVSGAVALDGKQHVVRALRGEQLLAVAPCLWREILHSVG